MALTLSSPVTDIPTIGPAKAKLLEKLGITHARDFIYTFPRRYDDFSNIVPISLLQPGERSTVRGAIVRATSTWGFQGRRRVLRIVAEITDETGALEVTWYNLRFLVPQLRQGRELFVAGIPEARDTQQKLTGESATTLRWRMRSPVLEFVKESGDATHTARIAPVYPETVGVTSRFIRTQVQYLLPLIGAIPDYVPQTIRKRRGLIGLHEAMSAIHFPPDTAALHQAQQRLRFDELFFLQLAALVRRRKRQQQVAPQIVMNATQAEATLTNLPFALTSAQQVAVAEIVHDLSRPLPMNRLLQGDVGSGKSVVAMIAAAHALAAKHTVLYLAPTEVLAQQQASSFKQGLGAEKVQLLVGSLKTKEKKIIKEKLRLERTLCVIGTHALLQEDVQASHVGLIVIDEQHRFGVAQRKNLQRLATTTTTPHLLSMTATPIPRTLNLTVYGDLDVSIINELPPGRQPITTHVVPPETREEVMLHVLKELHAGRQAYVIAPLVEASPRLELKSAQETYAEMRSFFPDIAIGLLHGRLPAAEKEAILRSFSAGALQLLVATVVVEVGINVPNATIMIIEGAERFGLAQLHQLRGRVGRGEYASTCYLLPTTGAPSRRLQILTRTNDGFVIAEEDLKLRGPGDVYGVMQSGFTGLQVASLLDYEMIKIAREEAESLLVADPELLHHPILQKKVASKNLHTHFE